ncbi:MFS transporter [Myceligenerans crystallogenes]|uniref:MFS transporter n=2 Tax=Myceligenerans crystallogenes TaxID=316335 RepID=A0ABP4ZKS3_9MICO
MFINKFGNFVNVFIVLYLVQNGYSAAQSGVALGVIGLGNMIGNIVGGSLADRIGRKPLLVWSMLASGVVTMVVPLFTDYLAIIAWLTLLGFVSQLFRPAAGALLVDSVPPEQRLTAFAFLRLAINVGMAVGPAVGGFLSSYSYTWMFIGDGITSILFGLLAMFLLKEVREVRSPGGPDGVPAAPAAGYGTVLRDLRFLAFLLAMVGATYVYIQHTATLPLHVTAAGFSNEQFGLLIGLNALLVVVFEIPITRLTGRFDARVMMCAGLVILGAGMALTGLSGSIVALAATITVWTVAEMVYTPIANAYPGDVAPESARGRYQGAEGLAHTIGATAGPVIGGALYAVSAATHWWLCLVIGLASAALVMLARKPPAVDAGEPAAQAPAVQAGEPAAVEGGKSA